MTTTNGSRPVHAAVAEIGAILEREGFAGDRVDAIPLSDLDSLLITEILAVLDEHVGHRIVEEAFPPEETTVADLMTFAEQEGGARS